MAMRSTATLYSCELDVSVGVPGSAVECSTEWELRRAGAIDRFVQARREMQLPIATRSRRYAGGCADGVGGRILTRPSLTAVRRMRVASRWVVSWSAAAPTAVAHSCRARAKLLRPCSVGLTVTPRPSFGLVCRWMRPFCSRPRSVVERLVRWSPVAAAISLGAGAAFALEQVAHHDALRLGQRDGLFVGVAAVLDLPADDQRQISEFGPALLGGRSSWSTYPSA